MNAISESVDGIGWKTLRPALSRKTCINIPSEHKKDSDQMLRLRIWSYLGTKQMPEDICIRAP